MRESPFPANKEIRLNAVRNGFCAYASREERFDRVTRTARRLLNVPIAVISIIEQDEQWFRAVQGLELAHTPRNISFCGHVVARNTPLCIHDTWADPDFLDNPLVTGPPGIRSYLGWPLEVANGVAAGSLCVIDTMPRTFGVEDFAALKDLASMAEAELRLSAMSNLQQKLMMQLSSLQRKNALDPLTGCWNICGFRELLTLGIDEARCDGTDLAICSVKVNDLEAVAKAANFLNVDAITLVLAQVLRQRLPPRGALARLGPTDYCALVPARSSLALEDELARLTFPEASISLPDSKLKLNISLSVHVAWLADFGPEATAAQLWASALSGSS